MYYPDIKTVIVGTIICKHYIIVELCSLYMGFNIFLLNVNIAFTIEFPLYITLHNCNGIGGRKWKTFVMLCSVL